VLFSEPYLEFNQGVAVNRRLTPGVESETDLHDLIAGIQSGNTSEYVAQHWLANGTIANIQYYRYDGILAALSDLEAGKIGLVVKLFPVISWLVKDRPRLEVAMQVPTHEKLGIAFARKNAGLCSAINAVLENLRDNGEFNRLQAQWFPSAAKA